MISMPNFRVISSNTVLRLARFVPLSVRLFAKDFALGQRVFELIKDKQYREKVAYERLMEIHDRKLGSFAEESRPDIEFHILVHHSSSGVTGLLKTLNSIREQSFIKWKITVLTNEPKINLEPLTSDRLYIRVHPLTYALVAEYLVENNCSYVLLLDDGDCLHKHALLAFAHEAKSSGFPEIIYCDSDNIDAAGNRRNPNCKPRWSKDYLLEFNYIGKGLAFGPSFQANSIIDDRPLTVRDVNYLLLLFSIFSEGSKPSVQSLQYILVHEEDKNTEKENNAMILKKLQLIGGGQGFNAEPGSSPQLRKIKWQLSEKKPLVSIIIPTKDKIDLLHQCLDSIIDKTLYDNYEIIIVDNNSEEKKTEEYFAEICKLDNVRVIAFPGEFNYSAINNFAVKQANGNFLAFLNNDIEVISPCWLNEMLSHAARDEVGCVGAKLFYPTETIQHGGVIIGYGGVAGHAHKNAERLSPGYMNRLVTTQNLSAVTAACLVMKKSLFIKVGGFDEANLKVAFNDVDLCLKVKEAGFKNIWTPYAELYHHESVSRGNDSRGQARVRFENEINYMKKRWKTDSEFDFAYNQNLALYREDFSIKTVEI